jgi:Tfp pilus assembly protein PilO
MQNDKNVTKNKYLMGISSLESEKNQKYLGIILTFCALSFFGFFAIKPTVSKIFQLQKEISDSKIVLEKLNTKIGNLSQLRTQYSNLQNDLPVVTNAITIQPETTLLFGQIQTAGKMSDLTIKKLQNFEVKIIKNDNSQKKDYYSYSFSIAGSGASENIYKFMQTLTNMERVISIDTFSTSNVSGQSSDLPEFNIQGTAYFKSDL